MYRVCNTAERDIGMLYYMTDRDGTGGRLKKSAEDFIVTEVSDKPPVIEDGKFTIAEITTKNWETNRLIRLLARAMRISRERIGFAGTKDKRAITTQLMSFECDPSRLDEVTFNDITIGSYYKSNRPIRMGDLKGNRFSITVRDIESDISACSETVKQSVNEIVPTGGFPNYFGVQRFGTSRPVTHIVGEKIVRGDIKGAVETYLFHPSENEGEEVTNARDAL
ncbi:MAG: tRNA pseudouridine(13) synthase TruD, partial [Candidatus Methanomethylophilaceae archaeon]|nr:tRNA pseudouridine(13) synthase TruD [Candidatus Methanomethylophilaceae archaeon]